MHTQYTQGAQHVTDAWAPRSIHSTQQRLTPYWHAGPGLIPPRSAHRSEAKRRWQCGPRELAHARMRGKLHAPQHPQTPLTCGPRGKRTRHCPKWSEDYSDGGPFDWISTVDSDEGRKWSERPTQYEPHDFAPTAHDAARAGTLWTKAPSPSVPDPTAERDEGGFWSERPKSSSPFARKWRAEMEWGFRTRGRRVARAGAHWAESSHMVWTWFGRYSARLGFRPVSLTKFIWIANRFDWDF